MREETKHSNTTRPLVSVIIPVRNGRPLIERVLGRLASQQFDAPFEVIVIDSGSLDGTPDCVPTDDQRFRLIEIAPEEFGHGSTRNLGIENAQGALCAFLTHDAVPVDNHWLSEITKPLRQDARVAGVFGRHVAHADADVFTRWEIDTHFSGLAEWPTVWIEDWDRYRTDTLLRQIYHFYSDNASCLRKSVWKVYPYLRVEYGEDQIWARTIIEAGFCKAYAKDAVVAHSHKLSLLDRVRRSYDESLMFHTYFGYRLCPTWKEVFSQTKKVNARDLEIARAFGWWRSDFLTVLRRPLDNFARQIGYYLGCRSPQFHTRFKFWMTSDKYKRDRTHR